MMRSLGRQHNFGGDSHVKVAMMTVLQCVTVCCGVLQCDVVRCSSSVRRISRKHRHANRDAMCCSVLQIATACCSVMQCVAVDF